MQANPAIAFCVTSKEMVIVRLMGEIKFSSDVAMKQTILDHCALVKSIYQTADNPIFEIFYLEHGKAIMFDFSGQPPKTYEF